jgi:hypothetical protein
LGVTLIKGESTRQVTGNKESENSFLLVYLSWTPHPLLSGPDYYYYY